jgi:uncharacterized membrane protein YesL
MIRRKLTVMKLSEFLGWIIGAIDLALIVYSIVDLTPFILMVGASITYMAIMVIKNRKVNAHANEVKAVLEEEAKKID